MDGLLKLGIDWKSVIFYVVNFGIIITILTKLVYKPLFKFLDARKALIRNSLESAEQQKKEFDELIQKKTTDSENAFREIQEARKNIDQEKKKILQDAESDRMRILDQARKESLLVREDLMAQVEDEMVQRITQVIDTGMRNNTSSQNIQLAVREIWKDISNQKKNEYKNL
ncbi:MAG: ATP synthase F0 subunit B [Candidatus Pacebacteria bacterium]|jgi:F-type H+-transporting ATPase subunit b|nr:ATP synthase F0 subunit B [Candidatus Paceibacterota bacterium]